MVAMENLWVFFANDKLDIATPMRPSATIKRLENDLDPIGYSSAHRATRGKLEIMLFVRLARGYGGRYRVNKYDIFQITSHISKDTLTHSTHNTRNI